MKQRMKFADWLTGLERIIFMFFIAWIMAISCIAIQLRKGMELFADNKLILAIVLLAGAITLFGFFYFVSKCRLVQNKKYAGYTIGICILLIVILQILFIMKLRIQFRYDTMEVYEEACNLLKTGEIKNWDYYGANAHQRGILYITWAILEVAKLAGIPEGMYVICLDFVSLLCIDVSLLGIGCYIHNRLGLKWTAFFAIFNLLHPFTYVWCAFYYTTIQCLPFMTFMIIVLLLYPKCNKTVTRILVTILFSLSCFVGNLIRPTILIGLVAYVIYLVMKGLTSLQNGNKKYDGKTILRVALLGTLFLGVFLGMNQIYKKFDNRMVTIDTDALERPMMFWAAMGAKGDGTWDGYDAEMLGDYPTKKAKAEFTRQLYIDRIKALGSTGIPLLLHNKLRVTWAEGNDDAISENASSLCYGRMFDALLGDNSFLFLYYCQIFRIFLFISIIIGTIFGFQNRPFSESDYFRVIVIGGILFHIFWEAKRLYSIPFMPYLIILAIEGIYLLNCKEKEYVHNDVLNHSKHMLILFMSFSMFGVIVFGFTVGREMVNTKCEKNYYVASQLMERCEIRRALTEGESLRQEFMASNPFNTIGVQVREYSWYYERENESVYHMKLTNSDDVVIREAYIYGKDMEDYGYCDTSFETVVPNPEGELYRFTIEAVKADADNYLVFYTKRSDAIDPYQWGEYVENGVQMPNIDMTFRVYKKVEDHIIEISTLLIFVFIHLFLQLAEIIKIIWLTKREKQTI